MKDVIIGSEYTCQWTVTEERLAVNVESGDLRVLATPVMAALMEKAAANCLAQFLEEGETSVGTALNIAHTSATPEGMTFTAKAVVTAWDGRNVDFEVFASDEAGEIGKGTHSRFVVFSEKFQAKTDAKKV